MVKGAFRFQGYAGRGVHSTTKEFFRAYTQKFPLVNIKYGLRQVTYIESLIGKI